jgi:hypothetical protein
MMGKTNTLKQLQQKLNNPLSSLWSLQLEQTVQWNKGFPSRGTYRTEYETTFQPAMPVPLTENWTWISRPIFTFLSTPSLSATSGDWDRKEGLAAFTYETWFLPTKARKLQVALGGVVSMPMNSRDEMSSRKYSAGPSAVIVYKHKDWVLGALGNWLWSFSGTDKRQNVNEMSLQYFITWAGLPNHWQINSSPTITYNRKAKGGNAWAVPIGIGVGKMVKLGKLPVKIQLEYDYYVVHPNDFGPRHLITLKFTPVIPALIKKPLL